MSTIDAQRVWLERIMVSPVIGFVVRDESLGLMQCVDGDPELRLALIEWQTQRIRELERSQRQASGATYPNLADILPPDGSGGQAGDEAAFAELAWQAGNAGKDQNFQPPTFPGS